VVQHDHEHVLLRAEPDQRRPNHGSLDEVDRHLRLVVEEALQLPFALVGRKRAQVHPPELDRRLVRDDLHRLIADDPVRRAQNLVPRD
jgi:hypothetical protein